MDRPDHHDCSLTSGEGIDEGLAEEERRCQVHLEGTVPVFYRGLLERSIDLYGSAMGQRIKLVSDLSTDALEGLV